MPLTESIGSANPTPLLLPLVLAIAVLMQTRRPLLSSNGPPLFPGFIAASVCTTLRIGRPVFPLGSSLPKPLTIPVVSVWSKPNGFPIAKTFWPTCNDDDRPSGIGGGDVVGGFFT